VFALHARPQIRKHGLVYTVGAAGQGLYQPALPYYGIQFPHADGGFRQRIEHNLLAELVLVAYFFIRRKFAGGMAQGFFHH
jgi:hypothetical protein